MIVIAWESGIRKPPRVSLPTARSFEVRPIALAIEECFRASHAISPGSMPARISSRSRSSFRSAEKSPMISPFSFTGSMKSSGPSG
jgi:hypothetical protein